MDDAALGSLIECGNQFPDFTGVRLGVSACLFVQTAEAGADTAVMLSAAERLPGTFRC